MFPKEKALRTLFPPLWLTLSLCTISSAALVYIFLSGNHDAFWACVVYALSFYSLCLVCARCVRDLPRLWRSLKSRLYRGRITGRFMTERPMRLKASLYGSLGINLFYVLINVLLWYRTRSRWFMVLAAYYTILSLLRFLLLRYIHQNPIGSNPLSQLRRARLCAYVLLLINLSLSACVLMILYSDRSFEYEGMLIYAAALYTFYSCIHAVADMPSYRKLGPVAFAAKTVSLSSALVSMLALETAMFSQFGAEMPKQSQQLMVMLTGGAVALIIVGLSLLIITRSTRDIRRYTNGK